MFCSPFGVPIKEEATLQEREAYINVKGQGSLFHGKNHRNDVGKKAEVAGKEAREPEKFSSGEVIDELRSRKRRKYPTLENPYR